MTTATLFATLRTQLADAQRPGLAGVRALEGAAQTVDALEDAVMVTEQRGATRGVGSRDRLGRHGACVDRRPAFHVGIHRRMTAST